ncbi:2-succinyl-5-enolpyruvyl-6-hydroxy-3-cyclohexene-1-carboxylic-acid synthase [Microbacterium sp. ASV81]|uniref:2-succinyl-5-enolpyruvyl-6-hydroxy-3-cyclohexene-1-carboxylate synthase n=1 Tax=Microbacterium capsulatum TaxID=3041921 RepID=A0ABU0XGC1_9MICO|nr:2-succinyl-5-enolpyruvyl-6-hydroxy-3-cyclohexene-1-carboxylic-acid synthase [Microbacterium sp. ASV81]MDQ4214171.1 2-succinyl-5-enolpyruvyl-6-hydroxy-3-cyclohexene-1-carboxylic-acid synthase [Microbacterium sp. ASV81]
MLTTLVEHGVRDVVLSPGSRSQALALAAVALARSGALRVHVRVDERVAGFTALGIARESGVPAALVCTSGTAAAGYLPAAMEAFHAGVPLILLTADRPPELRGIGANQATIQPDMYGAWVRLGVDAPVPGDADPAVFASLAADAVSAALGVTGLGIEGVAGPVHLNLPAREPLSGALPDSLAATPGAAPMAAPAPTLRVPTGARTVVVAGADAGPDAERIAREGGWPLIAEVVSGSRFGDRLVPAYRERLRDRSLTDRIERVIVLGHPTLSREVAALLARRDLEVIAVRRGGERLDLSGLAVDARRIEVDGDPDDADWLAEWTRPTADTPPAAAHAPLDRAGLVRGVWDASGPHDRLLFGSSRLVRVADDVLAARDVRVHSNRGLAGIDGTIATGIGIALAADLTGVGDGAVRVLLGDLTFLHDVGSLLLPADEPSPRIQVIVGNDGGGTIFDGLEVAGTAESDDLDRAFYTPQSVELAPLAAAYGWGYLRAETPAALADALAADSGRPRIIEVPLAR